MHFIWQERENKEKKRNDYRRQFDHHTLSCAISRGKGHNNIFKKMMKGQVWPPKGITRRLNSADVIYLLVCAQ